MTRDRFAEMHCSIAQTLTVLGEWWTPLILRDVYLGLRRFDELSADLGISRNLLAQRLEHLVEAGVLARVPYQERPPRFEYHLTEAGHDVVPALLTLMAWGDKWKTPPGGPPVRLVHDACGRDFVPQVACPHCGGGIDGHGISVYAGPGAAQGPGTMLLARPQNAPQSEPEGGLDGGREG
ncbi:winged helix-turn-helix transcriptional regulator [Streptosporangium sp. KLBMP 9127]|nr:helix-turn-helix transcriptional regulator [Streptosporangium sp. KLBMP 9127]